MTINRGLTPTDWEKERKGAWSLVVGRSGHTRGNFFDVYERYCITIDLQCHWLKDLTSYAVNKNNKAWFFDCSSLSLSYFVFKVAEVLAYLILYLRLLKS